MYYYLYQITNLVNNKIYVGVHKTSNLEDGYMGSGKVIKRAIEKHGIDNFVKVILETFENADAMYAREKEIVTEEFLAREDVYNLRRGGHGGFEYINRNGLKGFKGRIPSNDIKRKISETLKSHYSKVPHRGHGTKGNKSRTGIRHTEETRQKMSLKHRGRNNSQHGSFWITDGVSNKKWKEIIPEGWYRGRIVK